jgi:hypothetical protein
VNHGGPDPSLAASGISLVILAEAPAAAEPGEGPLDGPPHGEHHETVLPLELEHDLGPELFGKPTIAIETAFSPPSRP